MPRPIRQPSFAAGELSPSYWGRTDLERYGKGLRLSRDGFINKQGSWMSRPGTRLLGFAKSDLVPADPNQGSLPSNLIVAGQKVRLIPFYFSDTDGSQNAVLEFGHYYFRVWRAGQAIINAAYASQDGVTIYPAGDLYKIRYSQSGDVLYLACAGHPPCLISRNASNAFAFGAMTFDRPAAINCAPALNESTYGTVDAAHPIVQWQYAATSLQLDESGRLIESAPVPVSSAFFTNGDPWNAAVTYQVGTWVSWNFGQGTFYSQSLIANNLGIEPGGNGGSWSFPGLSALPHDRVGLQQLDFFPTGTTPAAFPLLSVNPSTDAPMQVRLVYGSPVRPPGFQGYLVYKGKGGVLGLIGQTTDTIFTDTGIEPDLTRQPPTGTNPFVVYDSSGQPLRTETPISVSFFEDRLCFGGTVERPTIVIASATADYENFDVPLIPTDDDSVLFTLSSRKRELIRSILGKDKLFILTNGAIWTADGSQGPLTPSSIDAHVHVDVGADWPAPVLVGNSVIWVRDQGTGLRAVEFDFSRSAYTGTDLSFQAEHLFLGHRIVDLCHAENPWGVTWAVREDGLLLSLTYCPDDQLWAWCRHGLCVQNDGTPQKTISVCTIPENGRDEVYLAAADPSGGAAWIVRFSERAELDDEALQSIAAQGGGLEYDLGMGLGQQIGGQSALPSGRVAYGSPICLDAWVAGQNISTDGNGKFFLGGFTQFAGRNVWVIVDTYIAGASPSTPSGALFLVDNLGNIQVPNPVVGAPIPYVASAIYVGLPIQPEGETLPPADGRDNQKVVNEVVLEVLAHGKFQAGASLNSLKDRDIPAVIDDVARVQIQGDWNSGGRAAWRQVLPLPLTVRAVTRKVDAGED